ncbi:Bifunctional ligase/repressor BirA [Paenibacillus sp. P1XP2]|nr:Bifunctional ligase/repressor BirA [Paenibacillus sp. P1XP2]
MSEKETLLDLLLASPQEFVSGEEISRRLSVSRTAVWKQINKLREAGYEFEAVPNKGYRIVNKPVRIDTLTLLKTLKTNIAGKKLKVLETTVSTQEEAKALAEAGARRERWSLPRSRRGAKAGSGGNGFLPKAKAYG